MAIRNRILAASSVLLAGMSGTALAQGLDVSIDLPAELNWNQVTNKVVGQSYSREWLPAGQDMDSAEWLIAQQKVPVDGNTSADDFLETIYELAAGACTSASHDDPVRHRVGDVRGALGRTMCAQRIGEEFGAFSDQLVFVEDGFAYVITSELRIPPMVVAGVLSFKREDRAASRSSATEFMDREELSRALIQDKVQVTAN